MNRNHFWRLVIILFIAAWSAYEIYPPKGLNIITVFKENADPKSKDATYSNIVAQAEQLQKEVPDRIFGNLKLAIGTNDITKYFPQISAKGEKDPSRFVLNNLQRQSAGKIKLGLDLQGGTSFLVGMDTNKLADKQDRTTVISHAVEVLRRRVDRLGVAEPLLQPEGEDRISIQLPGLSEGDKDEARKLIEQAAFLEFRMVHPDSDQLISQGIVDPGYEVMRMQIKNKDGSKVLIPYLVGTKPERNLTGKHIKRAQVIRAQVTNEPEIEFEFDPEGATLFGEITTQYQPKGNKHYQLAIVLDGELKSAPRINQPITGGRGVIQGTFEIKEAFDLANVLENPLEAPVHILEEDSVDPTLGTDTIKSGVQAAIFGTLAVAAFMIIYYLVAGAVANVALLLNILILVGVMCSLGTTFTLPGIAGIVLTVGMAVDANVLIYERIREETAKGKSLRGALDAGYSRAFGTIFDSHVTTLISSVILIFKGTGTVKGFGVALTIGVAASLFTSLVVTRLIFDFLLAKNLIKSLTMFHVIRATKLDFMKLAKPAFTISWLIILLGIGYGIHRGKDMLSVDFAGGVKTSFTFEQKVDVDKVRAALSKAGITDALVQYSRELTGTKETLRTVTAIGTGDKVREVLEKEFPEARLKTQSQRQVGAIIGGEILKTAIVAALLSLFGILIYVAIRYEFSFGVAAVVAVLHDVLMTVGCYCLTGLLGEGRQFNATFVAALLTIIGFSINDTIVIFDRIREDLRMGVRGTFRDLINQALNQTLSRTLITSGTVFLATLSLYIFGGGAINDFAFTFLVGIITGTYSSIYIASALVLWWHKGQRPVTGSRVILENDAATPPVSADSRA